MFENKVLTDFKLPRLFIVNVNPAFECLHHMEVGYVASVLEEHTSSIGKIEMRGIARLDGLYRDQQHKIHNATLLDCVLQSTRLLLWTLSIVLVIC
jgi:hypothetical protein